MWKNFFITNNEPVKVWDFINSILQSEGIKVISKTIPKFLALSVAWWCEYQHIYFRLKSELMITRFAIQELCTHHWFDISAAKEQLNYSPGISFSKGMKLLKNSYKQENY